MKVALDPSWFCIFFLLAARFFFSILTSLVFNSCSVKVNFRIKGKFGKWRDIDNPISR